MMRGLVCLVVLLCGVGVVVGQTATRFNSRASWGYADSIFSSTIVHFEEEMYLSEDLFCLPVVDPPVQATCLPCSYTVEDDTDCRTHVDPNSPNFDPQTQQYLATLPDCSCPLQACQATPIPIDTVQTVEITERSTAFLRYEHNSWDNGFVIRKRAITNYSPVIVVSTDPSFASDKLISESVRDHTLVCPSQPFFGEKENTVTYFIVIRSDRKTKVEIEIKTLPNDESHGDPVPFSSPSPLQFWTFDNSDLTQGAYRRVYGSSLQTAAFFFPINECGVYSVKFEQTQTTPGALWDPRLFTGMVTQLEADTLGVIPGPNETVCDGCFEASFWLNVESVLPAVSSDWVFGFCPKDDSQNYLSVTINSQIGPWAVDVFVRQASYSPFIESHRIADQYFSHIQLQERLQSYVTYFFPCPEGEVCATNSDFQNFLGRRNLMSPNFFPSLIYPTSDEIVADQVDLVDQISFETEAGYFLRCLERERDSACGTGSVLPYGDFATPLLYPTPEMLRSLNPLPSLVAEDLSYLFPRRADKLTLTTLRYVGGNDIISTDRLEGATITVATVSAIHTESFGVLPPKDFAVSEIEFEPPTICSYQVFHPMYEFMQYLDEVLQAAQTNEEYKGKNQLGIGPRTASYWAYVMTFTKEWQSCWSTGSQLVEYGVEIAVIEDSTLCTNDAQTDPCCNPRLEWESECCLKRDVVTGTYLPVSLNKNNLENNCLNPECMETFAQDFRELYQSAIAAQICVVNDEISTNISSIFEVCVTRFIGEQPFFGVSCFTDDDCDLLGDSNAYCDLAAKKCVADLEDQQNSFLNCLIDRMGSFTKSLVYQELVEEGVADPSNSDGNEFLTVDLLRDYAVDGEYRCLDDYGPLIDFHEYFTLRTAVTATDSTCPVCDESNLDLHCMSTFGCATPVQCADVSRSCANNFVFVSPECEQQDSDDYVCNWDNDLSRSDCDTGDSKCMYCFNSSYCVGLPTNDRDECENTPVCVLMDGSVMWDVDKDTCEDMGSCSDGGSGDEDDCNSRGYCEDPDRILESIEALIPDFPQIENATKGVCITPLEPTNIPPCPLSRDNTFETLDFTTQRGCVRIAGCTTLDQGGSCQHDPATENECENNFDGSWLSLPIETQEACENPLGVDDDDFPGFCKKSDKDTYIEPRNKQDCLDCGGTPVSPAYWKTPTWRGGQSVSAEWRDAEMVETYHYMSSTLSFARLESLFERAAFSYEIFILNSGESCLVNPFLNYLDIVACDCGFDDQPEQGLKIYNPFNGFFAGEECRDSLESDEIGTIWFCPDTDLQVGVISGIVGSLSEYVNGDLCFFSQIILASTSDFVGNRPSEPITVTNDPNELDPEPVRNQKGASVGVILGDGVGLIQSENVQPVDWKKDALAVELSFSIDRTVFDDVPDWYILDFGIEVADDSDKTQPSDEIEVLPTGSTNGATVGQPISDLIKKDKEQGLPIRVAGIFDKPFRYSNDARIYPIARIPDWEDEDEDEALDTGEQAMVGVFAGLYGIAFILTVVFLVRGIAKLNLSLLLLFFYLLATFSFRTAFWAIVASGDYEETSSGYYILIEPPSFFIVSVLTILIMSYACMVAARKGSENLGRYWLYWLLLQLFLIAVLFVVVGLMIGLDTNDDIVTDCFGRQSTVEENTIIRDIRIAYHSFLLFVAIVCCAIVVKIGQDLPEDDNKTTLQYLSALSGGAVVATSLLWVIYSAVDSSTPYFVIPLFFTEVPPLLLMTYLTFPSEAKQDDF